MKYNYYSALEEKQLKEMTDTKAGWVNYLVSAASLYKYPFSEQVMIHAQRPDATACASFDFWSKIMNRHINAGARGIDNAIAKIPDKLESAESQLTTLHNQVKNAEFELEKPFQFEAELTEKIARLSELDVLLNLDGESSDEREKSISNTAENEKRPLSDTLNNAQMQAYKQNENNPKSNITNMKNYR